MRRSIATTLLALGLAAGVSAQEPAKGPADIINRAQQKQDAEEMGQAVDAAKEAAEPAAGGDGAAEEGEGEAGDDAVQQAHGGMDEETLRRMLGQGKEGAEARPSEEVPAGTIRVRVVDGAGSPVSGQAVRVGIMETGGGDRRSRAASTDAEGYAVFDGLPTGDAQAYRVSVPHEGATYGATPFRLPPDRGYHVRIQRLPVVRDPQVMLMAGQSILELRNERVHVTQHAQLMNMSERTFVFPDEGMEVRLPSGFTAVQTQETMSDQRVEASDKGVRLHGSVPPGRATLTWSFDVPVRGSAMDFGFPTPFRTYMYSVIAENIPGMELEVDDFPPASEREIEAGTFMVTQAQRSPDDPPLDYVSIHLAGIPGPGPWRWIAVGGAAAFLLAGLFLAGRGGRRAEADARAREDRKEQLLGEAVELEQMFAREEIGPKYRQRRMDAVLDELSALLKLDDRDRHAQPKRAAADEKASAK